MQGFYTQSKEIIIDCLIFLCIRKYRFSHRSSEVCVVAECGLVEIEPLRRTIDARMTGEALNQTRKLRLMIY